MSPISPHDYALPLLTDLYAPPYTYSAVPSALIVWLIRPSGTLPPTGICFG